VKEELQIFRNGTSDLASLHYSEINNRYKVIKFYSGPNYRCLLIASNKNVDMLNNHVAVRCIMHEVEGIGNVLFIR
jgi:hypothetical protein